jgi:hypothetical protein
MEALRRPKTFPKRFNFMLILAIFKFQLEIGLGPAVAAGKIRRPAAGLGAAAGA